VLLVLLMLLVLLVLLMLMLPLAAADGYAMVYAPITHAMEMNMQWNGKDKTLEAGLLGSIVSVPKNYSE